MSIQSEKIGSYEKIPDSLPPESHIRLILQPIDMISYWNRVGLTADFMANFYTYNFQKDRDIQNTLSTILNELVENAVKFSHAKKSEVVMDLKKYSQIIKMEIRNEAPNGIFEQFKNKVKKMNEEDLEKLYFDHLENKKEEDDQSGLGLLMLAKDYPVELGFLFEVTDNNINRVTVRAYIDLGDL